MKKQFKFKFLGHTWQFQRLPVADMMDDNGNVDGGRASIGMCNQSYYVHVLDSLPVDRILSTIMHELIESGISSLGGMYGEVGAGTGDIVFSFNHKLLSTLAEEVTSAYDEIKERLGV